jgi:1,4-alpha-glucan branching enzyme
VRFNSDWQGYSADFANHPGFDTTAENGPADTMPCQATIGIGRYSALILSQEMSDFSQGMTTGNVPLQCLAC